MKRTCWGDTKYRDGAHSMDSDMSSAGGDDNGTCSFFCNSHDGGGGRASNQSISYSAMQLSIPDAAPSSMALVSSSSISRASSATSSQNNQLATNISPHSILAREMNNLSLNERESVYEDIHGVREPPKLSPPQIEKALQKMERLVKKSPHNSAYNKAAFLSPKYCKSIHALFLRTDDYKPKLAAKRLVSHFEKKLQLFGPDCLGRPIVWSDLDEDAIKSLEHGYFHYFPTYTDNIGRTIGFSICSHIWPDASAMQHTRATWYAMMSCIERNEIVQRRGMCAILFFPGCTIQKFYQFLRMYTAKLGFTKALPFRISVAHLCVEYDVQFPSVLARMLQETSADIRMRSRIHYGSPLECIYQLGNFGIAIGEQLPMDTDGNIQRDLLMKRLQEMKESDENMAREQREELVEKYGAEEASKMHIYARDRDVVMGRGAPFQSHPGTVAMMQRVENTRAEHDGAGLYEKKYIAKRVVQEILDSGSLFLQRTGDGLWKEVDPSKAHEKVAQGFRNLARNS
mmetsp:Transcript_6957/g.20408  ORF Transcript_6957/g.20408 Transcript_6957/m.20408 type:complete len:514 (+) Transcript_6957:500-2041(+)